MLTIISIIRHYLQIVCNDKMTEKNNLFYVNISNCFYLNHYNWSAISIEIWLNVCKQNAHPAINSGNIFYRQTIYTQSNVTNTISKQKFNFL